MHYSNDKRDIEEVRRWRQAAIEDGWSAEPTYKTESIETATRLRRDGFLAQIIARENVGKWKYAISISVWGPDRLCISLPGPKYHWEALKANLRLCSGCGARNVDTERYGFAGGCCAECRPKMAARHEIGNWTS